MLIFKFNVFFVALVALFVTVMEIVFSPLPPFISNTKALSCCPAQSFLVVTVMLSSPSVTVSFVILFTLVTCFTVAYVTAFTNTASTDTA